MKLIKINGYAAYIGNNPPKEVDSKFLTYEMPGPEKNISGEHSISEAWGQSLQGSKLTFSEYNNRKYELEIYIEAINNSYIEVKWKEQGEEIIEKIDLAIVS